MHMCVLFSRIYKCSFLGCYVSSLIHIIVLSIIGTLSCPLYLFGPVWQRPRRCCYLAGHGLLFLTCGGRLGSPQVLATSTSSSIHAVVLHYAAANKLYRAQEHACTLSRVLSLITTTVHVTLALPLLADAIDGSRMIIFNCVIGAC